MNVAPILTLDELSKAVSNNSIDTVLVVFPDLQGRPVGKRVVGSFFIDHVAHHGIEACDYLLAVDVDMEPVPGYSFTNWETGYGDLIARCDMSTLRIISWLPKTALVICDVFTKDLEPIDVAPRTMLKNQLARAAYRGFEVKTGTELEFFLFKNSFDEARDCGYKNLTAHSGGIEDYQIFETSREEFVIREIRNEMLKASIPVEFSKGEAGHGQHEINITYAEALKCADNHMIFKNGVREIVALSGLSATFMAKWSMEEVGSSCHIHSSLWQSTHGKEVSVMPDDSGNYGLSDTARQWIAGQLHGATELAWCYAHYVNSYRRYVPGSWAPTAIAWGIDNRTCGFRVVGSGQGKRVENRIPGADVNPYIALSAVIASGLYGIDNNLELEEPLMGNGYVADSVKRIPNTLPDAVAAFEASEIANEAFGSQVHSHYLNTARQEWLSYNKVITDWELRRNFERI